MVKGVSAMVAIYNLGWAVVFAVVGGLVGMVLVLLASLVVPRVMERLTPDIDEQKEMLRGNTAVAEYFGRVAGAAITGISIVMAAAVLGGVLAALH
jgi:hypothetical protein